MHLRFIHAARLLATMVALGWCVTACAATASPTAPRSTPSESQASAGPTPGTSAAASATPDRSVAETVRDFRFDQPNLSLSAGTAITVSNAGPTIHNLTIRDASGTVLVGTQDLRPGATAVLAIPLPPDTYTIFCSLPGHESLGLKGTLTVTP